MPIVGWIMHVIKKHRYVLLYYDIYPEALIRFGGLSMDSPLADLWRVLNRLAIGSASLVITISDKMAETLSQYFRGKALNSNLVIIPTWVDTNWIKPLSLDSNQFAQLYVSHDDLTILYAGNLGAVHDLSMLPKLAERLSRYPKIRFLIVSGSPRRLSLELQCQKLKLKNIIFLPQQPEECVPQILATGDIGIVSLAMGGDGISMPSKTYYMMAAGNALLGLSPANSELDQLIRKHECGINIEPGNIDDAEKAILFWHENRRSLQEAKERSRGAAESYYDKEIIIPRLLLELTRINV